MQQYREYQSCSCGENLKSRLLPETLETLCGIKDAEMNAALARLNALIYA